MDPPADEVVDPPADEVVDPPVDEVVDPPADEVVDPPSDEVVDPPADEVVDPPSDEVVDPPSGDDVTPPIDDEVKKPVECPPDLVQADEPQQLLSLQSLDSTQNRLSTGMRINRAKDDPAGLIVDQDGNCDPPPECPAPDGSQDVLSRLRDADFASETATDPDAAADPKDEPRSLLSMQTRLSTGLRVNSALDDAAKEIGRHR